MSNEITKFIEDIAKKYDSTFDIKEIRKLLEADIDFLDMPVATGKKLLLDYIKFEGQKSNGEAIDFSKEFNTGINIIIADNLKGKSTLFKVLKMAFVGDVNSIKADVKQWIKRVIIGFRISEKVYSIDISLEKRFQGILYSTHWKKIIEDMVGVDDIVFEANSNKNYCEEIQKFFFNQFSYYSLKWTQKNPAKDKNEMIEAGSSWKTYYKSIYLESKDSNSFYGNQEQKVFQMLLGLEYTYLINRLIVKKEMIQFELGKKKDYVGIKVEQDDEESIYVKNQLLQVEEKLEIIRNANDMKKIAKLQEERSAIIVKMNNNNKEMLDLNKMYKEEIIGQRNKQKSIVEYEYEERRIGKEIAKNTRLLNDLKEYIEVGQFFSNLEIKYCPSCNHEVHKGKSENADVTCPLCHDTVESNDDNKERYLLKINQTEMILLELKKERKNLNDKIEYMKKELDIINDTLEKAVNKLNFLEIHDYQKELTDIDIKINEMSFTNATRIEDERRLIAEKAVLVYRSTNKISCIVSTVDMDKETLKIDILEKTIEYLNELRFEKSANILNSLKKIMLQEIHEFGLNSITDIEIDSKFNIIYMQNGVAMKFDDIAEGEQLRVKLAFYLGLIQLDIAKNYGHHTRFLIIDSPNKEEGDTKYLEGLKEVLISINDRYKDELQIIIGTATRELKDIVEHQFIYEKGEYVF
jgi:hypothetical protein